MFPFSRNRPEAWFLLPFLVGSFGMTAMVMAQEKTSSPAAELQEQLKQWVLTRQLISREKADWAEQKATWQSLNEIRRQEKEQLEEFTTAARKRIPQISAKKEALADEEKDLRQWRKDTLRGVDEWEGSLRPLLSRFPAPLRRSLRDPISRLEAGEGDDSRPLQERVRDVVLILQGFREFQDSLTIDKEVLSLEGEEREVDVLYVGLGRAYFTDPSDSVGGYGLPSEEGWKWQVESSIAAEVRKAIEMRRNQIPPEFLTLPIPANPGGQP